MGEWYSRPPNWTTMRPYTFLSPIAKMPHRDIVKSACSKDGKWRDRLFGQSPAPLLLQGTNSSSVFDVTRKEGMPPRRAAVREFKDRTICNDKWRSETRSGVSLDTGFNLDAFFRVYLSGDKSFCCWCLFLSAHIGIEFEGFVRKLRIISYKVMDISSSHFCD